MLILYYYFIYYKYKLDLSITKIGHKTYNMQKFKF